MEEGLTITNEDVRRASESLRLGSASYHEKLTADGFRFDRYFQDDSLFEVLNDVDAKGLQKIVIIPANLVPEHNTLKFINEELFNRLYAIYVKHS